MPKNRVISRVEPRPPRFRNTITTIMLVLVTVMIVRDILVRRWASPSRSPDVTQRSP
jgi:hypothetical protein